MEANKILIDLTRPSSSGSGGSSDYSDLTNKPKINNNTLSGNKTSAQLGLVGDVQVNGTSVVSSGVANIPKASSSLGAVAVNSAYGVNILGTGELYTVKANSTQIDNKANDCAVIVPANLNYAVRSVKASYTTITATDSTYTLGNNAVYGQIPSQAVTYTLPTVVSGEDNWVKLFIDTTSTTSIAFSTTGVTLNPNGISNIESGHKYIVICQYNNLKSEWEIYIIDGGVVL